MKAELESVIDEITKLPADALEEVARLVHKFHAEEQKRRKAEMLKRTSGSLPPEIVAAFQAAHGECSRIEKDGW